METVLWIIGGIVLAGAIALIVVFAIVAHKTYKAAKKVHTAVKREFDDVWKSSSTTTRTYSPPARPVARSLSPQAPRKSSSSSSKRPSSGRSSSNDDSFLYGAAAASVYSSGSDYGSSYSSSSDSSSSSSSSSSSDSGGSCGGGGGSD